MSLFFGKHLGKVPIFFRDFGRWKEGIDIHNRIGFMKGIEVEKKNLIVATNLGSQTDFGAFRIATWFRNVRFSFRGVGFGFGFGFGFPFRFRF